MASTFANLTRKAADKIEQLGEKNKQQDNVNSSNYGPHSSNAANKLDPTVDSDRDGRNNPSSRVGGYGNTQAHDSYGTTTGPGGIGSSDTYGSTTNNPAYNNPQSTNAGPHNSNLLNKLDPRVDSDRDGRNDPSSRVGGYGNTQHTGDSYGHTSGPGGLGSTNTNTGYGHSSSHTGAHTGSSATPAHHITTGGGLGSNNPSYDNPQSTNAGPHNSNLLNKLDPRVDSDRDGRNDPTSHAGGYGQTQSTHGNTGYGGSNTHTTTTHTTTHPGSNTHHTGTQGYTGTNTGYDNPRSTNDGPHNSNLLNKLDPRVDSDRDGRNDPTSRTGGYGNTQSGNGSNTHTGADVGGLGSSNTHHTTHGQGAQGYTGTNTAYDNPQSTNQGPHNSNLLNKLDPRVDSDRDGRDDPTSRTGGYGNTQTGGQRFY